MAKVILTSKSSAMKSYLLFVSLVIAFASCTSVYKTGQTPDDVYFSPTRPQDEYVQVNKNDDRKYYSDDEYRDDRYLRMKIADRRWTLLDDPYYSYNYYPSYGNYYPVVSYGYSSPWNAAALWNYYYNPYCYYGGVVVSNPKSSVYNKPRTFNLRVFDNTPVTTNPKGYKTSANTYTTPSNNGNYRNSGSNAGNFLRNVFSGSGSSSSSNSSNTKTYSNSSSSNNSSSSSSSSSGSSSGGSSRGHATRGGN